MSADTASSIYNDHQLFYTNTTNVEIFPHLSSYSSNAADDVAATTTAVIQPLPSISGLFNKANTTTITEISGGRLDAYSSSGGCYLGDFVSDEMRLKQACVDVVVKEEPRVRVNEGEKDNGGGDGGVQQQVEALCTRKKAARKQKCRMNAAAAAAAAKKNHVPKTTYLLNEVNAGNL